MNKYDEYDLITAITKERDDAKWKNAVRSLLHSYFAFGKSMATQEKIFLLDFQEEDLKNIHETIKRWEADVFMATPPGERKDGYWVLNKPFRQFKAGDRIVRKTGGETMVGGGLTPDRWIMYTEKPEEDFEW